MVIRLQPAPAHHSLAYDSDYYIPRDKTSASVNLKTGAWKFNVDANYTSRLPNYNDNASVGSYLIYNGSVQYDVNENVTLSLAINNLFDTNPPRDPTWTSYPYYNTSWYDGRAVRASSRSPTSCSRFQAVAA